MDAVVFILNNVLLLLLSDELVKRFLPGFSTRYHALMVFALSPILIAFLILPLGLAGFLTAQNCLLILSVLNLVMLCGRYFWRPDQVVCCVHEPVNSSLVAKPYIRLAWLLLGLNLVVFVEIFLHGNSYVVDDLSYHMTVAAHWLKDQNLSLSPMNYHAYYPLNAELVTLWMMLPFKADGMVFLVGVYWLILTLWITGELVYVISKEKVLAFLACVTLLTTTEIVVSARTCCVNDLAPVTCLLAGFLFVQICASPSHNNVLRQLALFVGLLAGFAIGMRITYLPVGILLGLFLIFRSKSGKRIQCGTFFLIGVLVLGGFWYFRNYILTGNPLFPAEVGPFSGPFDLFSQSRTRLIDRLNFSNIGQLVSVAKSIANWPYHYFLMSILGYVFVVYVLLRRRMAGDIRFLAVLLLLAGCMVSIHFPFLPFSGSNNGPDAPLRIAGRFLIFPWLMGIILFYGCILKSRNEHWRSILLTFCFLMIFMKGMMFSGYYIEGVILSFVLVVAAEYDFLIRWGRWGLRRLPITGTILALLLAGGYSYWQRQADNRIWTIRNGDDTDSAVFKILETLPPGSKIAEFGRGAFQYYPLFGRRYHLDPVTIDTNAVAWSPLHPRWQTSPDTVIWWPLESEAGLSFSELVNKLSQQAVEYVLIAKDADNSLMSLFNSQNNSGAQIVCESQNFSLWKIK